MMKTIMMLTLLLICIPLAVADAEEMKIVITEYDVSHSIDDTLYISGQLMYANGSKLKISQGQVFAVYLLLNGEYHSTGLSTYFTRCNSDGSFVISCNRDDMMWHQLNHGSNELQVVYNGRDVAYGTTVAYSHLPCESEIVMIDVPYADKKDMLNRGYKLILMILYFMCIGAGLHVLKGHMSTSDGTTGYKIILGIIICTIILVCGPFIINMIL